MEIVAIIALVAFGIFAVYQIGWGGGKPSNDINGPPSDFHSPF